MSSRYNLWGVTSEELQVGDWVEIMDDGIELRGEPGILAQVIRSIQSN